MKKALFLLTAVALLTITSCNKNQKVVKSLEGTWNVTEFIQKDTTTDLSSFSFKMTYEACHLKNEGPCPGSWNLLSTIEANGVTASYELDQSLTYTIIEKGEYIDLTISDVLTTTMLNGAETSSESEACTDNCRAVLQIIEHTESKLVLESTNGDGTMNKITASKE